MTDEVTPADGETAGSGPTGQGYVFGETFGVRPVVYSVENGLAVFEGDIVLGTVEEMAARTALVESYPAHQVVSAVAIPAGQARWPDGVVPYELDPALPEAQRAAATNAVAHWLMHSRLALVARDAGNAAGFPDFIRYSPGGGCSSAVGRKGGAQPISLGTGCLFGQATHETGHAVGLWHEQSREDRDQFVRIVFANIDPAQVHNFDQHITDGDDIGPYDYGSIMHYPATAFSTNGQPTIVPLQPNVTIGQRTALSPLDRAAVRAMYPELEPSAANTWAADFTGDGPADLLYYLPSRRTWSLGSWATGNLVWTQVGDTGGFGQLADGRPFWAADLDGDSAAEMLFYSPADGNWWLGDLQATQLTWTMAGSTLEEFGRIDDGRPVHLGRFTGGDATEVLFYSPGDDTWQLGSWTGKALAWTPVGTGAFPLDAQTVFCVGDFGDDGRDVLLKYSSTDNAWWEGMLQDGRLDWWQVATTDLGDLGDGRPISVGRFSQPDRSELLFRSPDDGNWWLGALGEDELTWARVGTTAEGGVVPQVVDLTGDGRDELAFFDADGSTHLGTVTDGQLAWTVSAGPPAAGAAGDDRPLWVGAFSRKSPGQLFSYVTADGGCWVGSAESGTLHWVLAATFEA